MNIQEIIDPTFRICKYRLSENCVKYGPEKEFKGNFCNCCIKAYHKANYEKNKNKLKESYKLNYKKSENPVGRPRKVIQNSDLLQNQTH